MINDFPAYGNLSGCSVKGYKACLICGDNTSSIRLKYGEKKWHTLDIKNFYHKIIIFHRQNKSFNAQRELGSIPEPLSREVLFEKKKLKILTFIEEKENTRKEVPRVVKIGGLLSASSSIGSISILGIV